LNLAPVVVRAMKPADIPGVVAIAADCFPRPWPATTYAAELEQGPARALWLVAQATSTPEAVVGYAGMTRVLDEAHVEELAVAPAWRGRGVARKLLRQIVKRARRAGCRVVTLEVRRSNEAARRLYGEQGFVEVGVRSGYYSDNGEDAILLTADIAS
jgi:ribosomal-protein-alanine N-acetyltransferase